jgi:hypothetical protein
MGVLKLVFCVGFFFLITSLQLFSSGKESLESLILEVGDIHEIQMKNPYQVNLSKKGVVLLNSISNEKWRIVAHRRGFVVLSYRNSETEEFYQILIEVHDKKSEEKQELPNPFCQNDGIYCTENPMRISGESSSWEIFYQLKSWCQNKKGCVFSLRLEEKNRLVLQTKLENYLSFLNSVSISSSGVISALVDCHESGKLPTVQISKSKELLKDLGLQVPLHLNCLHEVSQKRYQIFGQVILVSKNFAHELGGSPLLEGDLIDKNFSLSEGLLKHLKARENESEFEIIGRPVLDLLEGIEGITKTGGEISLVKENSLWEKSPQFLEWKSYGLSLKTIVHSNFKGSGRTRFHLNMSVPSEGGAHVSLETIEMQGEVILSPDEPKLVGTTDYERKKNSKGYNKFLSKIPLIGPFFQLHRQEKVFSRVYLYLMLKEINEMNEQVKK